MAVTIKDIAQQAQVSITTVSMVLNNNPTISEATRNKVNQIIKDLNYTPNARARSISSGKASTIALVTPPWQAAFSDPYYTEMIRGSLEAARSKEYQLILEICDDHFLDSKIWNKLYDSKKIDGMLIATPYLDQRYIDDLYQAEKPLLLINGERPDLENIQSIGYDDTQCGLDATNFLLQLGHTKIAHISGPQNQASAINRIAGYKKALENANLPFIAQYIEDGNYMPLEARDALIKILNLPHEQRPTAFFCANDTMASSVITYLQEIGYSVPKDFSVIGVDDNIIASTTKPSITTFKQDIFELSFYATTQFLNKLDSKTTDALIERLPMEIVVRDSTARA